MACFIYSIPVWNVVASESKKHTQSLHVALWSHFSFPTFSVCANRPLSATRRSPLTPHPRGHFHSGPLFVFPGTARRHHAERAAEDARKLDKIQRSRRGLGSGWHEESWRPVDALATEQHGCSRPGFATVVHGVVKRKVRTPLHCQLCWTCCLAFLCVRGIAAHAVVRPWVVARRGGQRYVLEVVDPLARIGSFKTAVVPGEEAFCRGAFSQQERPWNKALAHQVRSWRFVWDQTEYSRSAVEHCARLDSN